MTFFCIFMPYPFLLSFVPFVSSSSSFLLPVCISHSCYFSVFVSHIRNSNICVLFNGAVSSSDYIASDDIIMNWKGYGRKWSCPNLGHFPGIFLEGLRDTTKILSQDSRSPHRYLNTGPSKYEAGELTTRHLEHRAAILLEHMFPLFLFFYPINNLLVLRIQIPCRHIPVCL
jgi:hypothetical protein